MFQILVVEDDRDLNRTVWEEKGLELECQVADGVHVEADPELLKLVWSNLFSNAIKFTPAGGDPRPGPAHRGRPRGGVHQRHRLRHDPGDRSPHL